MKQITFLVCGASLLVGMVNGCGKTGQSPTAREGAQSKQETVSAHKRLGPTELAQSDGASSETFGKENAARPATANSASAGTAVPEAANMQPFADRKIIFTAEVHVKVADMAKAESQLQALVTEHKGYIAQASVGTTVGAPQQSHWKVRVPVAEYTGFCTAVKQLGETVRFNSESREVTEEYFDLQSRVKNKESELAAVRKIFEQAAGNIDQVVKMQRELSRAEGELEVMKGRQRVLDNITELTTITVFLDEPGTYKPPTVIEPPAPTPFGTTLAQTFNGSVNVLTTIGKALAIAAVAAAPWLPLAAVVGLVTWLVWRRRKVVAAKMDARAAAAAKPA